MGKDFSEDIGYVFLVACMYIAHTFYFVYWFLQNISFGRFAP